jgi:hypothetical protein
VSYSTSFFVKGWELARVNVGRRVREMNRRSPEKREERIDSAALVTILIACILLSGFFINSILSQSSTSPPSSLQPSTTKPANPASGLKAAIVDQESLTDPNQTFVQTATSILTQAGYAVDYYSGGQVTVDFYRNLPTHGYSLIILRVHCKRGPSFFTSELYDSHLYPWLQLWDLIGAASYYVGGTVYFAIPPSFITSYVRGTFNGSTIIAMGCFTMEANDMAEAFVENGANAYIGWSGPVTASHTDQVTTSFLGHLLVDREPIAEAVNQTMREVGPDPTYNSVLLSLTAQPKQNNETIGDYKSHRPITR